MVLESDFTAPIDGAKKPTNKFIKLDLPAPVFPTIPVIESFFIVKFISFKIKSLEPSYLNETLLNSI